MVNYGTDIAAVDDLPDPEVLCSGEDNVVRALARRLLQPPGVMEEIGEPDPYDSIDLRDWQGRRLSDSDLRDLEAQATQVLAQDERVLSVEVSAAFAGRVLSLEANGNGTEGPFAFILSVDDVSAKILQGGS